MKKVKAKFRCISVTDYGETKDVHLQAVTGGSEENKTFWKYTPAGDLKLNIDNPEADKIFSVGCEYYLDISQA